MWPFGTTTRVDIDFDVPETLDARTPATSK
jgi:hypothetical protein